MPFYLYALAPLGTKVGRLRGVAGEPLKVLAVESLVAIAGELALPPSAATEQLQAQDAVIRALAAQTEALLPARFGTKERSAAALVARLEPLAPLLQRALDEVRGCEQMTLRVFSDAPNRPAPLKEAGGAGTRYLLRAKERRSPALPELDPLRRRLRTLLRAERVKGANQPPLRASVFHLIPRGGAQDYQARLRALPTPPGMRWLATGPFPPYAFAPEELS